MPERALMVPLLYLASLLSKPARGWLMVKTFSPDLDFAEETKGGGFLKVALVKRDLRQRTVTGWSWLSRRLQRRRSPRCPLQIVILLNKIL